MQFSKLSLTRLPAAPTLRVMPTLREALYGKGHLHLIACTCYEGPLNIEVLAEGDWSATPQIAPGLDRQGQPPLTRRSELLELSERGTHEFADNPARIITDR